MSLIHDMPLASASSQADQAPDNVERISITAAALPMKPSAKPALVSLGDINEAAAEAAEQQRLDEMAVAVESSPSEPAADAPAPQRQPAKQTRRPPLPMVERLKVMETIRQAPANKPDAELANAISMAMDRAISSQMVRLYRQQLGLASVPMPSRAELAARLAAAEAALAAQRGLPLDGASTS